MKKNLHTIKRIVLVQLFVSLFSIAGFALNTEGTEKKTGEKTEKEDSKKEKPDSVGIDQGNAIIKAKKNTPVYSPDQYLEQDRLDEAGSVVSFNFIQYIIENFKFSEETF